MSIITSSSVNKPRDVMYGVEPPGPGVVYVSVRLTDCRRYGPGHWIVHVHYII